MRYKDRDKIRYKVTNDLNMVCLNLNTILKQNEHCDLYTLICNQLIKKIN